MGRSALQDTLGKYQRYLSRSGFSPVTIKNYVGDIKHFATWLTGSPTKPLLETTGDDIRGYCLELEKERAHSPATVNRRLQSIRNFFRYASEFGLVETDPSVGIKLLPQPRSEVPRGLNQSEIERLLDTVRQEPSRLAKRDYAIVQLMLRTGIRVGELTRLRLSDVVLSGDEGVLKIRGQGASSEREVPLNSSVREAIDAYLEDRPASADDHLFLSRNADPLSVRSVQRLVSTYAEAAGLDKVSTYTLRQTCGEHMLRDTGDLSLVARVLGHKRLETAIKYVLPRQ